jgi:hypothetical protein
MSNENKKKRTCLSRDKKDIFFDATKVKLLYEVAAADVSRVKCELFAFP